MRKCRMLRDAALTRTYLARARTSLEKARLQTLSFSDGRN